MLQVRIDDETKKAASAIFEKMGMDISTAVRVFLTKCILEGGMPFDMKLTETQIKGIVALDRMRTISEANGNSEMTLDEINEEIRLARLEREKRNEKNLQK